MMKLPDIHIGKSLLSDTIYIGTLDSTKTIWVNKIDRTDEFIKAVIDRWCGCSQIVNDKRGNQYEIQVKEIKTNLQK